MRALVACSACRSRRRKCQARKEATTCLYCSERGLECVRASQPNPPPGPQQPVSSLSRADSWLTNSTPEFPAQELRIELVELYFDLIHDQFHSLFHRPSFMNDVRQRSAPPVILYAMMALSARFSTNEVFSNTPPRQRSKFFYDESAKLLDLRNTSIITIQACILLGAISTTEGDAITESVYYTIACRMANLLDLSKREGSNAIDHEINVRVWWTLCMVDVWSSRSVRLPRQMIHLEDFPFPINEAIFLQWTSRTQRPPVDRFDSQSSLLAQMIKLNRILLEINDVITQTAASGSVNPVLEHTVHELSQKLDDWHEALPKYMHHTAENLARYAAQGFGRLFVAVYLGYYHYCQLLFYQFLHENGRASRESDFAKKCKAHAANLCRIIYEAHAVRGCEVWYNMVGHILVIASTVQIHTLLFNTDEVEISAARGRLEKNFQILTQLREYWPMLDGCFERLQIFHEVCRKNMDTSFRMDQWMLKFLSEFKEPITEKEEESPLIGLNSVANIGTSPLGWV